MKKDMVYALKHPDAIHKENFESPITKAGEVYDTTTVYKFC